MQGLKDKRVLITGGASGIGAATAARFLEEGSRVCVLDRDTEACARIKHDLAALGAAIIADVTDLTQVEAEYHCRIGTPGQAASLRPRLEEPQVLQRQTHGQSRFTVPSALSRRGRHRIESRGPKYRS